MFIWFEDRTVFCTSYLVFLLIPRTSLVYKNKKETKAMFRKAQLIAGQNIPTNIRISIFARLNSLLIIEVH